MAARYTVMQHPRCASVAVCMSLDSLRALAGRCAALELCLSPQLLAASLSIPLAEARQRLANASAAGLFRRVLLPSKQGLQAYQPTAKGAGLQVRSGAAARTPRFLRSGLAAHVVERALLRAHVALVAFPSADYLSGAAQSAFCCAHAVPERGHARALVSAHWRIYVPVLAHEAPARIVTTAAARWLSAFESVDGGLNALTCALNFVTVPGRGADALRSALEGLRGPSHGADLASLDARIAQDRTGVLAIRHAAERAALATAVASSRGPLPWLGEVVEAAC